ncbi:MAG: DUF2254 domain-containing protein [Actinobacteria bacterium]|nr:DUF2254 domain-containing protein [Actinomycetota bacterium]
MTGRLRALWQNLLAGFWFVPGAVAVAFAGLALVLIEVDRKAGPSGIRFGFGGDAGAARDILATIAGSLITVAGLTFSLTIVVLTLISSQFTPRALRGFLADRVNQVTAGAFVGIFLYCLLVLGSVRGEGNGEAFVPALSVTGAIALGFLTLVLLLLFIHHMGQSIQASHIAARVAQGTLAAVDRLHPELYERAHQEDHTEIVRRWFREGEPESIGAPHAGYVQLIDLDALVAHAPATRLEVTVRPGDFVTEDSPLVRIWPAGALDAASRTSLRRSFAVESERDLREDPSFGIRQLSDIAIKALSPGINDPTTAVTCIGYLQAVLERLAGRAVPPAVHHLEGNAVMVVQRRSFEEYVDDSLSEIGRYSRENARVVLALLSTLSSVGDAARRPGALERLGVLRELGEAFAEPAVEAAGKERDKHVLRRRLERLLSELA